MATAARPSVPDLERLDAEAVLRQAVSDHHPRLVMACSFQKEESVLLDMLMRIEPAARVFTIDTGVLFEQTRATWRAFEDRWGVSIEVHDALRPGGGAWTGPDDCCSGQKVAALERALDGVDAWITGIRREQAPTREAAPKLDWDGARGIWKFSPLADWSEKDLWRYIHEHELPYNELHDEGYGSIGCAPCTQPGSGREGRWAGQDKTECGIHVDASAPGRGA